MASMLYLEVPTIVQVGTTVFPQTTFDVVGRIWGWSFHVLSHWTLGCVARRVSLLACYNDPLRLKMARSVDPLMVKVNLNIITQVCRPSRNSRNTRSGKRVAHNNHQSCIRWVGYIQNNTSGTFILFFK